MSTRKQEFNDMKEYVLSNLELTIDTIDSLYHYDRTLEEFHVYRNIQDTVNAMFNKPYELAQAISKGVYNIDHPYFYLEDNKIHSVTKQEYIDTIRENITNITQTFMTHELTCLYFTKDVTLLQKYTRP